MTVENYPETHPDYPHRPRPRRLLWLIAEVVTVIAIAAGSVVIGFKAGERHEAKLAAEAVIDQTPKYPTTSETTFGDGTWKVGTDIKPGSYVAPGGSVCYWELRGPDRRNGTGSQIQTVTIGESDTAFKSVGCGLWMPRP